MGYIWALKPSDLSVLQGCLMEKNSHMATPKGSNNDVFWSYLVEKKLAQEENLKVEPSFEAKSFSLTGEGEELLSVAAKYALDNGFPPNDAIFDREAVMMLTMYSNKNDLASLNKLGTLIENGIGIFQSYEEARKLYERAAKQGHAKSIYDLGRLEEHSKGSTVKYISAYYCYHSAIERGFDAKGALDNLKKKMSEHELKMAQSMCTDREYFTKIITANIDGAFENKKLKSRSLEDDKSIIRKFLVWHWLLKFLGKEKKINGSTD